MFDKYYNFMTSLIGKVYSPLFGLTNTYVLVNSGYLSDREKGASCTYNNVTHVRSDAHFLFSKSFSNAILTQVAVRIPLTVKCVLFWLKKSFNNNKLKRLLAGIDYREICTAKVYVVNY